MMEHFSQMIVSAKAVPTSNQGKRDGTWDHFRQETEAPLLIANRRDNKGHRFPYYLSGTEFMRSIEGWIEAIHGKPAS
jgi:hypothetical protein